MTDQWEEELSHHQYLHLTEIKISGSDGAHRHLCCHLWHTDETSFQIHLGANHGPTSPPSEQRRQFVVYTVERSFKKWVGVSKVGCSIIPRLLLPRIDDAGLTRTDTWVSVSGAPFAAQPHHLCTTPPTYVRATVQDVRKLARGSRPKHILEQHDRTRIANRASFPGRHLHQGRA